MAKTRQPLDSMCVNTIRGLAMDMVETAKSGHPGAPMGLAAAAFVLWTRVLKHNPRNPGWVDRDRFVLSAGHASALLYSLLYLCGYDLSLDELKRFRQWGSKTPGHPEYGHTPGVETTTGPLGQGFANAVGMAIAERHLAARFNRGTRKIVDHFTFVFCGDGDMMEGITSEAASLAGHLGLGRLICLYDDNRVTIDGATGLAFTEDVARRFGAYHWQVLRIKDGNDLNAIRQAFEAAKAETGKPSLIVCRTHIGFWQSAQAGFPRGPRIAPGAGGGAPDQGGLGAASGCGLQRFRPGARAFPPLRRARREGRGRLAEETHGLGAEAPRACRRLAAGDRRDTAVPAGIRTCRPLATASPSPLGRPSGRC